MRPQMVFMVDCFLHLQRSLLHEKYSKAAALEINVGFRSADKRAKWTKSCREENQQPKNQSSQNHLQRIIFTARIILRTVYLTGMFTSCCTAVIGRMNKQTGVLAGGPTNTRSRWSSLFCQFRTFSRTGLGILGQNTQTSLMLVCFPSPHRCSAASDSRDKPPCHVSDFSGLTVAPCWSGQRHERLLMSRLSSVRGEQQQRTV